MPPCSAPTTATAGRCRAVDAESSADARDSTSLGTFVDLSRSGDVSPYFVVVSPIPQG